MELNIFPRKGIYLAPVSKVMFNIKERDCFLSYIYLLFILVRLLFIVFQYFLQPLPCKKYAAFYCA